MRSSSLFARASLAIGLMTIGACAQSQNNTMITKHDFAGTGQIDFAGADLYGVDLFGFPPDDMGDDMVATSDMSRLTWTDKTFTTANKLWSVWSNGTTVWAVGDAGLVVSSTGAAAFTSNTMVPNTTTSLYGIFGYGAGPSGLYAVGDAGAVWTYAAAPSPHWVQFTSTNGAGDGNTAVWIAPDGQVFAVGVNGTAKKLNTMGTWDNIAGMDVTANALWGVKTGTGYTLYACGNFPTAGEGRIWKYTGATFVPETSGATGTALYGVYGFSETDIYVVGDKGTILHSTGTGTWTPQTSGTTASLNAIGGASADEVYIVGDGGLVLHKYGAATTTWVKETLTATQNFLGVWANAAQVWAVGANGAIFTK